MRPAILITGGAGLLAINWAAEVRAKYDVTLVMHNRRIFLKGTCTKVVNLNSVNSISDAIRETQASIVVHCAAMTNVDACENNPDEAFKVNVDIARNVAQACAFHNAKLIHISTDHLFSGTQSLMNEKTPMDPINVYARTKAKAETFVLDACPTALVLRTNFFGWGSFYRYSFSDIIIESLRKNKEIDLFVDAYFTPILISFLVQAAHDLINHDADGIYHVVGDERLSKYNFGLRIAQTFGLNSELIRPILLVERSDIVSRPLDLSLDNGRLIKTIGRSIGDVNNQLALLRAQETSRVVVEIDL